MNALLEYVGPAAKPVVQALMNGLWQGLLLTAMVWLLLRAMRHINAATRFAIWWVALIVVVFLPLLNNRLIISAPRTSEPPSVYQPISHSPTATAQPAPERIDELTEVATTSTPAFSASDLNGEDQNRSLVVPVRFLNARWIGILFFLWLLGSLVMLGRLMRSYFHLCHLKRTMTPLHEDLQQRLGLCSLNRVKRQVGLGASSRIMSPVAAGFAKPTILVPESLVDELTESEFDSVVLHELAHIRRMDDWLNLAQKIIEAVLFFNPSVWWIGRQLSLEREIACDDCVVSLTGKSKPYAACLLKLAEVARLRRITMLAPGAVLARNQISRRIEMLMDKKRNSTTHLSRAIVLTIIALLAIAVIKGTEILPALALDENAASAIASVNQVINDQSAYQPSTPAIQYSALAPASKAVEAQPATSTTVAPRQELKVPIPPTPPSPPQVVPTPPQSVPSLPPLRAFPPVPPISASEKDQARYEEQKRKYDEQVRQYEIGMEQYRKQMEIYEGQMQQYNKEMAEYEKQMQAYHEQMSRYEEEMKRYHEEMKKFEQQIHDMIPLVVRRLISDEMRKIDTDARDRIDSATEQVSSSIAEELISKVRDFKINRPGGYIALVSELTAKEIQAKLSSLFRKYDLKLDGKMKEEFDAALSRVSPSLQWLVVYRFGR